MQSATATVATLVKAIAPLDALEQRHIDRTLTWLATTDDIYRRIKPATPSPHLVAYVILVDPDQRGVYLGLHRNSGLHLPMGGHVEPGEHPLTAARREAAEELGIDAEFTVIGDQPLMVTVTTTVGRYPHEDVSVWYVARGDRSREYALDPAEFARGRWWDIDPYGIPESDPHLGRFLTKLHTTLPDRAAE
ncbi:NUDIX domain-containing protein [Nocardia sp. CDC159]|uniref:NUDIX domain-containing protein n=1 Tax=Nocardia pulmonis TaxID=2951408 RepID=A0A9X2IZ19_9NOCA|nr:MULTISPECIES: NUDIX domain-containing protein [Nocardia]MCM6774476.1 NUDIX domain-containing protein [Nocardia pulmonis]MCM6787458.1 NUDIX domain-containing protein [Nocardia sp. CDC159]